MPEIRHRGECGAPLDFAFAYVDDYRNTTDWMFGLSRFEPAGDQTNGVGAVFDGTFAVRPVKLSSTVRCTDWAQDDLIGFESIKGFANRSTWRFSSLGPERTRVDVVFGYDLPGGLAGRALGKALEPVVTVSVRQTDAALRRHIAAAWATRGQSA